MQYNYTWPRVPTWLGLLGVLVFGFFSLLSWYKDQLNRETTKPENLVAVTILSKDARLRKNDIIFN